MPKTWNELKRERFSEAIPRCEVWHTGFRSSASKRWPMRCGNSATEAHHIFINRSRRYKKHVNRPENAQDVCNECHGSCAKNWFNKVEHMKRQKERYDMKAWWDSLPEKLKETNKDIGRLIGE